MAPKKVQVYDTTLRDGMQGEGIAFSLEDKLRIAQVLDDLGVDYIEGGWPNETNPKDRDFFRRAKGITWRHARLAAFGSTCRAHLKPKEDSNLRHLLAAETPTVTIFGKSWDLHVRAVLRTTLEENLRMIEDSVRFLKAEGREVIYDAEHFFDGYAANPEYALKTLQAAEAGGADLIVLCDTNGGSLPLQVMEAIRAAQQAVSIPLGIHTHNDAGMAVANSILAVQAGCIHVQGTFNGYGERCGNANLCSIIPTLELKLGIRCLPQGGLQRLTEVSRLISELANLPHDHRQPYVGASAFAHKGGAHIDAVRKAPRTFEHIPPETVGNQRRILVSEMSGTSTLLWKLESLFPQMDKRDPRLVELLLELKELEHQGYQFEGAEGSFYLLAQQRLNPNYRPPFELVSFRVVSGHDRRYGAQYAEGTVRVRVGEEERYTVGEGNGPVNALDMALRKALLEFYPELEGIQLVDYKVRVLNGEAGTAAKVRVLIECSDGHDTWGTVGIGSNSVEAGLMALVDGYTYGLLKSLREEVKQAEQRLVNHRPS